MRQRLFLFFLFIAGLVFAVVPNGELRASGYTTSPSVDWLASSVPTSSKIDLTRIVSVDSIGRRSWTTKGPCSVKGNRLVTTKDTGSCVLALRIGATKRFSSGTSSTTIQVRRKSELNVLAAASLTTAFTEIGNAFTSRFLNVSVKFNFAGSSTLATQIQQGAPVDVVAMADTSTMEKIIASGQVSADAVATLVKNKLAILVQRGNPSRITSLSDLTRPGVKVVLCDSPQPCGKYAAIALSNAKVTLNPAGREASASGVVSRVGNGEADAGIAYITDGLIAGDKVDAVSIPESINVLASYPIASVKSPSTRDLAAIASFIATTTGTIGDSIFARYGFMLP